MTTHPHSTPYTRDELEANLNAVHGYLRRACEQLGTATDAKDVQLQAQFIASAGAEIQRWQAALDRQAVQR